MARPTGLQMPMMVSLRGRYVVAVVIVLLASLNFLATLSLDAALEPGTMRQLPGVNHVLAMRWPGDNQAQAHSVPRPLGPGPIWAWALLGLGGSFGQGPFGPGPIWAWAHRHYPRAKLDARRSHIWNHNKYYC